MCSARLPIWLVISFLSLVFLGRSAAGEPETVKVGVCLSLSGAFRSYGVINMAGINLFVEDYNAKAAETGVHIELVVRDDKGDPDEAAAIVRELATGENIQVIVGPVTSGIMFSMIEEAKKHQVVLVSPAATNPNIGKKDDWAFKILPGDDYQGAAIAKFFQIQMGFGTAAVILNDHYDYGEVIFQAFRQAFEAGGGKMVSEQRFTWDLSQDTLPDFVPMLSETKKRAPDMLLLPGYVEEGIAIIKQAEKVGLDTVFCGGDAWLNQNVIFRAGAGLDDSYYIGGAEIYSSTPAAKHFVELLEMSSDIHLDPASVNGYDAMLLVAEALRQGARTGPEIRRNFYEMKSFPLAAGNITLSETSGTGKTLYIYRIQKMGKEFFSEPVYVIEPE